MTKKYYAVKAGRNTGIYETWDECKKQVAGFSGASYKSFTSLSEANNFLGIDKKIEYDNSISTVSISEAIAYVDGSYNDNQKEFSYGLVMFANGVEEHFAEKYNTENLVDMRNVAGEIVGAQKAMQYCIDKNINNLDLYYDYEGIEKWCTGEWKANKLGTKVYKQFYDDIKKSIKVNFHKIAAHTGNTYNELADQLAKGALNNKISSYISNTKDDTAEMVGAKSIYIDREHVDQVIFDMGHSEWSDFNAQPLKKIGNQERCIFYTDGKEAILDFYFKKDGATTVRPTGVNIQYSNRLAELIENQCYKNDHRNSSCTFNQIDNVSFQHLIDYLNSIEKINIIENKKVEKPAHQYYKFKSSFGDSMVIKRYDTGKLLFQGNPAYIFTEALYFMSLSSNVSIDEIIKRKNETYKSEITVDGARAELKKRIPNIYDKLDDKILKVLSPSIALSQSGIMFEDYSCYVFPSLKALEAHLLNLLSYKSIYINAKNNFGTVYKLDKNSGLHVLTNTNRNKINDSVYSKYVEDVYNYFKRSRHIIFHANQVLSLTKIIETEVEANVILNEVLDYFDKAGIKKII